MDILDKAIIFATEKHSGATRKKSNYPYILHTVETAAIIATITTDREILAAAVLHDVVEDAGVTVEELKELFGEHIAELVKGESENKRPELPPSETWKIRKQESIDSLKTATLEEKMLFVGDKVSNIRSMKRDFERIGPTFWNKFHCNDPKEHEWYYRSILEGTKELADTDAWKELEETINYIFK